MRLFITILGFIAIAGAAALFGVALYIVNKVQKEDNMKRTEAMRAARHKPKESEETPKEEVKTETPPAP